MGDFISHKGRGLIIVLYGPPGTGKTFAVESLAEFVHRPLLALSIGDLIADPKGLRLVWSSFLNGARRTGARFSFLTKPTWFLKHDLSKTFDEMASYLVIFLRKLDYFEGIMFLTTNRIGTIDPAFMSKIQISIPMEKLTDERLGLPEERLSILEKELNSLAKLDLNGRQIRNTSNIAQSFAHSRNRTKFMMIEDLTEAPEQALGFQEFFKRVNEKARNSARSVWSNRA
ncbi:hypothetical protein DL95DRAFT_454882 [Leptodontidium sp. 2 PMI_412]|nr:hypothetical protein DL95DRAFT_454882 [Leptodontidium sp. 2 PMI_412]